MIDSDFTQEKEVVERACCKLTKSEKLKQQTAQLAPSPGAYSDKKVQFATLPEMLERGNRFAK